MAQDEKQEDSSEVRGENANSQRFRSPCLDAHHEAFILRSSWTVGNLYAANLTLGQSYVKQVKDLERQRKVWLSRKEKEQETMMRRWKALKKQTKNNHHSNGFPPLSEVKDNDVEKPTRIRTSSQVASLEKLATFEKRGHVKHYRSTSQPAGSGFFVTRSEKGSPDQFGFQKHEELPRTRSQSNACSVDCAFASNSSHSGRSLSRSLSSFHSGIKSTEPHRDPAANNDLIPRWLPSNLRSRNIREKSLV